MPPTWGRPQYKRPWAGPSYPSAEALLWVAPLGVAVLPGEVTDSFPRLHTPLRDRPPANSTDRESAVSGDPPTITLHPHPTPMSELSTDGDNTD